MERYQAMPVWTGGAALAEGPLWREEENRLYWVDIEGCKLHILNPADGTDQAFDTPGRIGVAAFKASGGLLGAVENTLYHMDFADGTLRLTPFLTIPEIKPGQRFNDGECDPAGRFLVGSIAGKGEGYLFSVSPDGTYKVLLEGVTISNGIAFSPDKQTLYYIDTPSLQIVAYDYDLANGTLANKRVVRTFGPGEGSPDGMTVDRNGNCWVAHWDGFRADCCTPGGEVLATVAVPVGRVTAVAFGGAGLNTLYLTTAAAPPANRDKEPLAGGLFMAEVGVGGLPPYRFG